MDTTLKYQIMCEAAWTDLSEYWPLFSRGGEIPDYALIIEFERWCEKCDRFIYGTYDTVYCDKCGTEVTKEKKTKQEMVYCFLGSIEDLGEYSIIIWRQDQLQEIALKNIKDIDLFILIDRFKCFIGLSNCDCHPMEDTTTNMDTMEQFWLAFVMKSIFNKTWSTKEKDWVEPKEKKNATKK